MSGVYLFQTHLRGGGGGGGLNLAKTMVSGLHKELEYKGQNLTYKKFEVTQPKIKKQIRTSSW